MESRIRFRVSINMMPNHNVTLHSTQAVSAESSVPCFSTYLSFVVCLSHFCCLPACHSSTLFEMKTCREVREYYIAIFSSICVIVGEMQQSAG
jgi:hypothetical protein